LYVLTTSDEKISEIFLHARTRYAPTVLCFLLLRAVRSTFTPSLILARYDGRSQFSLRARYSDYREIAFCTEKPTVVDKQYYYIVCHLNYYLSFADCLVLCPAMTSAWEDTGDGRSSKVGGGLNSIRVRSFSL